MRVKSFLQALVVGFVLSSVAITSVKAEGENVYAYDVMKNIRSADDLGAHSIEVLKKDNSIVLSGAVNSEAAKQKVELLARDVAPNYHISNNIVVDPSKVPGPPPPPKGIELERQIIATLKRNNAEDINVKVDGNEVFLGGNRNDFEEIDRILSIVLNIRGVEDIKSDITLRKKDYSSKMFTQDHDSIGES